MIRITNIIKALRQACWVLLLALYAAAALKVDSIHELIHSTEFAELHSVEQESNPCHKSVYHQEAENGCEHKSHITENTKCALCECKVTPDQLVEEFFAQSNVERAQSKQTIWCDAEPTSATISLASRGPPVNV
jgi:hypothetical protein